MSAAPATTAATWEAAITSAHPAQLDHLSQRLWVMHGQGELTDEEASWLSDLIKSRRPVRSVPPTSSIPVGRAIRTSHFVPRRRQASPDREASRNRRTELGASGALPNGLRAGFTLSELAVLTVIAGEVKRRGICDLPIDQMAAQAGVCRTSVQNALHEGRRRGLIKITYRPRRGAKSLPNLVEIISPEWRAWIKRGAMAHRPTGSKTFSASKNLNPTKIREGRKERKTAFEEGGGGDRSRYRTGATSNGSGSHAL